MSIGLVETCQLAWQPEKSKKAQKGEKKLVVLLVSFWMDYPSNWACYAGVQGGPRISVNCLLVDAHF
jgi:hypothetical protein